MSSVQFRAERLGRKQHGWVTRAQLADLGVARSSIHRMVRGGRWQEGYPGVIDLGTHASTWRRQLAGAVLAAGPQAWASHRSAAYFHGFLDVPRPGGIDVLVPRGRSTVLGGLRLHTTRSIGRDEVTTIDGIPVTGRARTLLDLSASTGPDELERYLANLARREPAVLREAARLTDRHRRAPGRRRLLEAIGRLPGDVGQLGSPLEVRGVQKLRQLGAPPFVIQFQVRDRDGAPIKRVDVAWPELMVVVEFDGAGHHDLVSVREDDVIRRERMRALGWHVEVVRHSDLDGDRFAAFVARLCRLHA